MDDIDAEDDSSITISDEDKKMEDMDQSMDNLGKKPFYDEQVKKMN